VPPETPGTEPITDDSRMPFGMHEGEKFRDIPAKYLLWLGDQEWLETKYPDVYAYIEDNRMALEDE
jgi:hypothetical protein